MAGIFVNCYRESVANFQSESVEQNSNISTERVADPFFSEGLKFVNILKRLSHSRDFRTIIKNYYESRVGDSTFDYVVSLSELRASNPNFDNIVSRSLTPEEYSYFIDNLSGVEINGKVYIPSLFNFYYEPNFKELAEWDGDSISEVIFNYEVNGKFYGYRVDGSVVEYTDINGKLLNSGKWVFEWSGLEKPFIFVCNCYTFPNEEGGGDPCLPKQGKGNGRFCGFGTKLTGCIGFCIRDFDITPTL